MKNMHAEQREHKGLGRNVMRKTKNILKPKSLDTQSIPLSHLKLTFNPLHPNISIYILNTIFYKFPLELTRRIHLTIKAS